MAGSKYTGKHDGSGSSRSTRKTNMPGKDTKKDFRRKSGAKLNIKLIAVILIVAAIAVIYGGSQISAYMNSDTDIRLTDEGYTHNSRFDNSIVVNGIDVSVYQGEEIEWSKVKTSGADFVFIRGGYRSSDDGSLHNDSQFEENMNGADNAGIMKGVYFYSQAVTPEEATEEAEYLVNLVKGYDVELPLVIDYEIYNGGRLHQSIQNGNLYASSLYHNIVLAFCDKVESEGYESMVYANLDMLTNYMDYSLLQQDADIWLASYDTYTESEADYSFWQCSQEAVVGGISGNVDHDFWYIEPGKVYSTRAASSSENRISIGDCEVSFNKDSYNIRMRRANPKIEVTYNGESLREGRDYEYSLIKNTESGTGYVILRGIEDYRDWTAIPFTIN